MSALPLSVETFEGTRSEQNISGFNLSSQDILDVLSMYDPYGVWRLELNSGLVYWSDDVFLIHGLEVSPGPVNLNDAINAYHPDDARVIGQLIEECIASKSGFRFTLRLLKRDGGFKLVKAIGKYRETSSGNPEIIGVFTPLAPAMRTIAAPAY